MNSQVKVYFFGDSICFGQHVSIHKTWVVQLSKKFSKIFEKEGVDLLFQNPSINGNTTLQALDRIAYDVQAHTPDIVIIQFGMNDCNYWQTDRGNARVSKKSFQSHLEEIVDRVRLFGAGYVVLNTNHPSTNSEKYAYADCSYMESNAEYNQIIRNVADIKKVNLIDIEKNWLKKESDKKIILKNLLLSDGVHLSEKGHEMYFKQIYPIMKNIILHFLSVNGKA